MTSALNPNFKPVGAVIANCKRLIADAELLRDHGRHGSAMSLAILAFEEAGKGHREEMEWSKTKRTPSWHQFRQIVAGFALQLAVLRKYKIAIVDLPSEVQSELQARAQRAKTVSELFRAPLAPHLKERVAEASRPALEHLSGDQAAIAEIEMRYVRLILEAAARGEVEVAWQRGMYVDIADGEVGSDPASIGAHEVYRWIFAAKRALLLLETGDDVSPFSPLAERLEGRMGSRPKTDKQMSVFFAGIVRRVAAGEDFIDVYFSTLPKGEQAELRPSLPMLKALVQASVASRSPH